MSVFIEPVRRAEGARKSSKLRADSLDELEQFVTDAGLDKATFVAHDVVDQLGYYEVRGRDRRAAIKAGAERLDWTATYERIADQIVAGTRKASAKQGKFGLTRTSPAITPGVIDLRDSARTPTPPPPPTTSRETETARLGIVA